MKSAFQIAVCLVIAVCSAARADDFASQVDLSPVRSLAVQHQQTIKTFDSFARQTLSAITGSSSLDGQPAVFIILDMSIRPEVYRQQNLIYIRNVPLRKEFLRMPSLSVAEQERIVHDGTVSLTLWMQDDVQQMLQEVQSNDVHKADAIGQANGARGTAAGDLLPGKRGAGTLPPVATCLCGGDGEFGRSESGIRWMRWPERFRAGRRIFARQGTRRRRCWRIMIWRNCSRRSILRFGSSPRGEQQDAAAVNAAAMAMKCGSVIKCQSMLRSHQSRAAAGNVEATYNRLG